MTGADIGAITSQAFSHALETKLKRLEDEAMNYYQSRGDLIVDRNVAIAGYLNAIDEDKLIVRVDNVDFDAAIESFVPSVSAADYAYYENLKSLYEA